MICHNFERGIQDLNFPLALEMVKELNFYALKRAKASRKSTRLFHTDISVYGVYIFILH